MPPVFSIPPEYRQREVLSLGGIEINQWYDCRRMFAYRGTLKISVVEKNDYDYPFIQLIIMIIIIIVIVKIIIFITIMMIIYHEGDQILLKVNSSEIIE